jgi:hypothetical protein
MSPTGTPQRSPGPPGGARTPPARQSAGADPAISIVKQPNRSRTPSRSPSNAKPVHVEQDRSTKIESAVDFARGEFYTCSEVVGLLQLAKGRLQGLQDSYGGEKEQASDRQPGSSQDRKSSGMPKTVSCGRDTVTIQA